MIVLLKTVLSKTFTSQEKIDILTQMVTKCYNTDVHEARASLSYIVCGWIGLYPKSFYATKMGL